MALNLALNVTTTATDTAVSGNNSNIGTNADITASTTGSTTTGLSNMTMSGTFTEAAAANLKAVGLWNVPGNEMGQYAVLVVKINEHIYGSTGTPGFST